MGAAGLSAYSASKHALRGLCDCLRLEVRKGKNMCFFFAVNLRLGLKQGRAFSSTSTSFWGNKNISADAHGRLDPPGDPGIRRHADAPGLAGSSGASFLLVVVFSPVFFFASSPSLAHVKGTKKTKKQNQSPAAQRLSAALSPPLADPDSTARAILKGALAGRYLIPTDARSGSLVAAAASTAPGVLPWPLAALLAPFLLLLVTAVRFGMEIGTRRALLTIGGGGVAEAEAGREKAASVAVAADGTGSKGGGNGGGSKKKV